MKKRNPHVRIEALTYIYEPITSDYERIKSHIQIQDSTKIGNQIKIVCTLKTYKNIIVSIELSPFLTGILYYRRIIPIHFLEHHRIHICIVKVHIKTGSESLKSAYVFRKVK